MAQIYRVLYRAGNNSEDYELHVGRKGTSVYLSVGAARSAVTQFRRADRFYGGGEVDYKIQTAEITDWSDVA